MLTLKLDQVTFYLMRTILYSFLDLIFPQRCTFCDSISKEPICPECVNKVRVVSAPLCKVCGIPFRSDAVQSHTCGDCVMKKQHFSWARGVLLYSNPASKVIHRYKYRPDSTFSRQLGRIISDYPLPESFDVVIPVPLHIKRLRERGFNQSLLLAKAVGKRHRIPVDDLALKRVRWTEPQVNLSGRERKVNVRGAFEVHGDVRGKKVLLIDDVYTTGATVSECSRVLRKKGARMVAVLTLARTADL